MTARPQSVFPNQLPTYAERERVLLAPYAMHSVDSKGRRYFETEHQYRGPFQRDRDRILHSAAFRRLSGKMQVFTGEMGDYHRTRLTHTYEVASIARTIGRTLRLNEDLIEALALFHDIGHPPFGHAGEDTLHACLEGYGGFSHNRHALTIAEELEVRYHAFPGLNLTSEVLEGQFERTAKQSNSAAPLLEVQLVDAADSITYDAHDVDDALKLGLVQIAELKQVPLLREIVHDVQQEHTCLTADQLRMALVHGLIDRQVSDVLAYCGHKLKELAFENATIARQSPFRIGPDKELAGQKSELETFLYEYVYRHRKLMEIRHTAKTKLGATFTFYIDHHDQLPPRYQKRAESIGLHRSVGEYLAGMTDRFLEKQFSQMQSRGGEENGVYEG